MKKIIYLLLLPVMMAAFTACNSGVEDVFDKPAAERVDEAISQDMQLLTSATNGWKMEYYGNETYGGYNVLCKFNTDNTATVESDMYGPGKSYTSHFKIDQSQGIILSFDEYNPVFHFFSYPANPAGMGMAGDGMEGDFEFRVQSVSQDTVMLKGKKHEQTIIMTRLADDFNWDNYLDKVGTLEAEMLFAAYNLVIDGTKFDVSATYRSLSFVDPATGMTVEMPYIQTDTGFQLKDTLNFNGKVITGFTYSEDDIWPNPADQTVSLQPVIKPLTEQFVAGYWYMSYSNMGTMGQLYWDYYVRDAAALLEEEQGITPFTYAIFGTYDLNGPAFGLTIDVGGYWGTLVYDYTIVSDDEITMEMTTRTVSNGGAFASYGFNAAGYPLGYIDDPRTFKLTADNVKNPRVITLTDESEPANVIKLNYNPISLPLDN